jgi:CubicO group peptidase (beta-lactamase class C family)
VFTGTLLADMVARGEVSLGYPVVEYLPKGVTMPARAGREITLADLSTHPSGLPNLPDNLVPRDMSNPYADYTFALMYDFLSEHELRRDIGSEFEYSSLGVGLLGHVLARHAETDYESLVRERIFEPLGMSMSTITLSGDTKALMVRGHDAQAAATAGLGLFSPGRLSAAESAGAELERLTQVSPEARIRELGIELPTAPRPIATYVPAVVVGNVLYAAGHTPRTPDGGPGFQGKVGDDYSIEQGQSAAYQCGLNILATVRNALGSLDRVERLVG